MVAQVADAGRYERLRHRGPYCRRRAAPNIISEPRSSRFGQFGDFVLGKGFTLALTALAFMVGLATFIILARGSPLGWKPGVSVGLVLANMSMLLMLGAVLAGRLTRVWVERRRGSAGSRLHVRLVFLFSGIAVAPTIVVACFAVAFFHFGIQSWFNDPVRASLAESLQVSRGYLEEHRNNIRSVALEMANDLARAGAVPVGRSDRVRRGAGYPDHAARPDRGGDLRADDRAGAGRGRHLRRHGRRGSAAGCDRRRRCAAMSRC